MPMDEDIAARINQLVEEEHHLHGRSGGAIRDEERERLLALEVQLDQCWDLLRQRRARRAAGGDPDDAAVRPAAVVEHYRQ
jgi:hypothetical protein